MSIDRNERGNPYSFQNPAPVDNVDESSRVQPVTGETVQFVVAETNVDDAGSAAGTVVYARLANSGILDSMGISVGIKQDTSFSWGTGTTFTTMRPFPYDIWEKSESLTREAKISAVAATLAAGEYVLDHRSRLIIGKKADTGTSDTASYKYRTPVVATGGGDASAANQLSEIALLTTIDTDTSSIATDSATAAAKLTTIDQDTGALASATQTISAVYDPNRQVLVIGGSANDPTALADATAGTMVQARFDTKGRLIVTLGTEGAGEDLSNDALAAVLKPLGVTTYTPDMDTSAAAEASSVTKAAAGVLYGVVATNSSGSGRYWQAFNSASVPADTTVPFVSIYVAAGGSIDVRWLYGRGCSTGISWCWSSTAATKTVGSTDGIADVQYK